MVTYFKLQTLGISN